MEEHTANASGVWRKYDDVKEDVDFRNLKREYACYVYEIWSSMRLAMFKTRTSSQSTS